MDRKDYDALRRHGLGGICFDCDHPVARALLALEARVAEVEGERCKEPDCRNARAYDGRCWAHEGKRIAEGERDDARSERDEMRAALDRIAEAVGAVHNQSMGPSFVGTPAEIAERVQQVTREMDALQEKASHLPGLTAELDGLRYHYDAAAPEHNLPALLDLYLDRQRQAEAHLSRIKEAVRYASAELRHAYRDQRIDRNLVARAIETPERAAIEKESSDA